MGACTSKSDSLDSRPLPVQAAATPSRQPQPGFVYVQNGNLRLLGVDRPLRFASFNAPELTDGSCNHPFEVTDTMRSIAGLGEGLPLKVTRTYTLRIKCERFPHKAHVMGWDDAKSEWILNEECWRELDRVLSEAAKHDVKLIIPMINQCTGKHSNWVGDVVDLCCLRHNCGYDEGRKTTFWSDRAVIDSFKQLITVYLNRVNTINGRRYGSDPTVLAWETGNEMNFEGLGKTPAPGAWTVEIAEHIKSLAPDTLVMDGSYARNDSSDCKSCYAPEVLASPAVELLTYHFYNDEEGTRAPKDAKFARKHGKAWISGEYGFFRSIDGYQRMLDDCEASGAAGSLIWSLRPHAGAGGFKTHREIETVCSYHVPGREPPLPAHFDPMEAIMTRLIHASNYSINGLDVERAPPIPLHPPDIWARELNNVRGLTWRGSAWATHYEIWEGQQCVFPNVHDSFAEGELHVPVPRPGWYRMRAVGAKGTMSDWSNTVQV